MEYWDWLIAFKTGWSMEYIKNDMPLGYLHEFIHVKGAMDKLKENANKRARFIAENS